MSIIWRITLIAWNHRVRLLLAYLTILVGVGLSLLIPKIVGVAIDKVVRYESGADGGSLWITYHVVLGKYRRPTRLSLLARTRKKR